MGNLYWTKVGEKHFLKNDDATLIELVMLTHDTATCIMGDKVFNIQKKGFWRHTYSIVNNAVEVAKLTHQFWGSNGTILFADGSSYSLTYTTGSNFKLIFREGENVIITFGTKMVNNSLAITYNIGISMIDAEKLLLLSSLGMVIFYSMCKENLTDDDTNTLNLLILTA